MSKHIGFVSVVEDLRPREWTPRVKCVRGEFFVVGGDKTRGGVWQCLKDNPKPNVPPGFASWWLHWENWNNPVRDRLDLTIKRRGGRIRIIENLPND